MCVWYMICYLRAKSDEQILCVYYLLLEIQV